MSPRTTWRCAARSFWAMAVCLPLFVCLRLLDAWAAGVAADDVHASVLD